ncbi:MAG TPA: FecR domain-containing protein [Bacteroidales bacterium]|nr:FecR domain-containing protein [Bacteroidales bacterium]
MEKDHTSEIDILLNRCIQGTGSSVDFEAAEKWISESPENRIHYLHLKNISDSSVNLPVSTEQALEKVIRSVSPVNKRAYILTQFRKIAAILFFPLLVYTVWLTLNFNRENKMLENSRHTVSAAFGSYSSLTLPDGSKVWLNSGSQLSYPERFTGNNRNVYLKGEAYFEVHSDKSRPFFVNTPYFRVRATGTKFNVDTYNNQSIAAVTLVEGRVSVEQPDERSPHIADLKPGECLKYDTLMHLSSVFKTDTYKYIAWKDGKLVFRNDPLSEVVHKISMQYNVEIEILDKKTSNYRYRATFENQPLNELLELLKMSAPIDYREISPVTLPDHTFSKRKIIIYATTEN